MQLALSVLSLLLSCATRRPVEKLQWAVRMPPGLSKLTPTLNPARRKTLLCPSLVLPYVWLSICESVRLWPMPNLQTLVALKKPILRLVVACMILVVVLVLSVLTCTMFNVVRDVIIVDPLTLTSPTIVYPSRDP